MKEQNQAKTQTMNSPISDLEFDFVSVLHNKGEALQAYTRYIQDARNEKSDACVELFQQLFEEDSKHVEMIKQHLNAVMFEGSMGSNSSRQGAES